MFYYTKTADLEMVGNSFDAEQPDLIAAAAWDGSSPTVEWLVGDPCPIPFMGWPQPEGAG